MVGLQLIYTRVPIDSFSTLKETENELIINSDFRNALTEKLKQIEACDGYRLVENCWNSILYDAVKEYITPARDSYEGNVKVTLDGRLVLENMAIYKVFLDALLHNPCLKGKIPCYLTRKSFIIMATEYSFRDY